MAKYIPEETKNEALRLYAEGLSSTKIAQQLGVNFSTVSRWAGAAGILRSPSERSQKYNVDHRYFEEISDEHRAYWLGFLYADGCVHKNALSVSLAIKDRKLLELLREDLGAEHPIRDTKYKYAEASLKITSSEMVSDLAKHGIHPRKTYTGEFPQRIPRRLVHHFVRGVFDGDGWISLRPGGSGSSVGWIGQRTFLLWLADQITQATGLPLRTPYVQKELEVQRLIYSGNRQNSVIRDWMYKDATVFLSRKKDRFDAITTHAAWPDTSAVREY